jgi:hypothetical protein
MIEHFKGRTVVQLAEIIELSCQNGVSRAAKLSINGIEHVNRWEMEWSWHRIYSGCSMVRLLLV